MNRNDPPKSNAEQREALRESEKQASAKQPENFRDEATDEKQVEILPIDKKGSAIKGIDPKK